MSSTPEKRSHIFNGFLHKIAEEMKALPHQERVSKKLQEGPGVIAYHGLGSGKTFTAIHAAREAGKPLLAVVPASLRENFRKELRRANFEHPHMVVSYEQARKKQDDPEFKQFASNAIVAFDEAQRMGRVDSARSELPYKIPGHKKLFLTGTPIRNRPEEIIPLAKGLGVKEFPKDTPKFKERFIEKREISPGFIGRLRGVKPGIEEHPKGLHEFKKTLKPLVDYHSSVDKKNFPEAVHETIEVPMSDKQLAAYRYSMGKYPALAYKVMHGIPPGKEDIGKFKSFLTGPRRIANTPSEFSLSSKPEDAAKINRMVEEIKKHHASDPNFKGVTYSTYLKSGIRPVAERLKSLNIPHAEFTGAIGDKQKKQIIEDYNKGKIKHLLISGAGAEGLDLKGTKLLQVMEPHWNEAQIEQVIGRGVRYKSHTHLPEPERKVKVQRFHAIVPQGRIAKFFGLKRETSADEYLHGLAKQKKELNEAFLKALKE